MYWDLIIAALVVWLSANGWRRGIVHMLPGLMCIPVATLVVQNAYLDFAVWLGTRVVWTPVQLVFVAYLISWLVANALMEIIVNTLFSGFLRQPASVAGRTFGALYGMCKALIMMILPLMVVSVPLRLPLPPAGAFGAVQPIALSRSSGLIEPILAAIAVDLRAAIGPYVISSRTPVLKPHYEIIKIGPESR